MEKFNGIFDLCEALVQKRRLIQRRLMADDGIYPGQPEILQFIEKHPGCAQKQIADAMHVTPPSIAASLKRLENAGFVRRRTDTADTRCNRVYISEAGKGALDSCKKKLEKLDTQILSAYSEDIKEEIRKKLEKMMQEIVSAEK